MITENVTLSKLNPLSLAIAIGAVEGLYVLLFAWIGSLTGYGVSVIEQVATFLPGFNASFSGGLIGGVYGFVDGFIFGLLAGYIYNCCIHCFSNKNTLLPVVPKKRKIKKSR